LGVDVNVAARVMERATRGGLIVSGQTLDRIPAQEFELLGVSVKRVRRQVFAPRQSGVPTDLVMYRVTTNRDQSGEDETDGQ
jgi:class 3 adenylate cyclase